MSQLTEVSVVIPTLRERESLAALLPRLFTVLQSADLVAEVLIVDDNSRDGTDALCSELAKQNTVRLITRIDERGLATAVLRGLSEAAGEICVVMDADGSHPPAAVPDLVAAVRSPFCDVSIGSRYTLGGSADENWGWFRRLNSSFATLLARGLTKAADPMAGFFAVRKSTLAQAKTLSPVGYKILLEIIVRADCRRIVEVPIHFRDRALGQSKLSIKQQWLYLRHLAKLYAVRYLPAWADRTPSLAQPTTPETPRRKSA
jgi:dolichol-phosphate mannosyltransferase